VTAARAHVDVGSGFWRSLCLLVGSICCMIVVPSVLDVLGGCSGLNFGGCSRLGLSMLRMDGVAWQGISR
jgi:hypothetical protein